MSTRRKLPGRAGGRADPRADATRDRERRVQGSGFGVQFSVFPRSQAPAWERGGRRFRVQGSGFSFRCPSRSHPTSFPSSGLQERGKVRVQFSLPVSFHPSRSQAPLGNAAVKPAGHSGGNPCRSIFDRLKDLLDRHGISTMSSATKRSTRANGRVCSGHAADQRQGSYLQRRRPGRDVRLPPIAGSTAAGSPPAERRSSLSGREKSSN